MTLDLEKVGGPPASTSKLKKKKDKKADLMTYRILHLA